MDDDGRDVEAGADFFRHLAQAGFGFGRGGKPERRVNLLGFLEVEAESDAAELLELADGVQGVDEVGGGAFFGVGEVEEERAAGADRNRGEDALDQIGEDRGHVGNHRPVHEGDEIGGAKRGAVAFDAAERGGDVGRGELVEAAHGAEHELAVGEFDGGGVGGFDEGDDPVGAGRELGEDRVDVAAAEGADVGDTGALGEQGVAHDRAVAAEFVEPGVELEVGALAGGAEDALAELGNTGERREIVALTGALGDRRDDGVDEAVEADQSVFPGERATVLPELVEGAGFEVHGLGEGVGEEGKIGGAPSQTDSRGRA